jgi:hypothetical protein
MSSVAAMANTPSLNVSSREADIVDAARVLWADCPSGWCVKVRPRTIATGPAGP